MYIHTTNYAFKHIYNVETLQNYYSYAGRDIKRLYELVDDLKKYQNEVYEHLQVVQATPFKKSVMLNRSRDYGTNRIVYRVALEIMPDLDCDVIEGNRVFGKLEDLKVFEGRKRREAFAYAQELSEKYQCSVVKTGYWGKY